MTRSVKNLYDFTGLYSQYVPQMMSLAGGKSGAIVLN
jgi:hypothetical protein